MATLDGVWPYIGGFGRFQRHVYALLNLLTIVQCCQSFLTVFITDKPRWICPDQESSLLDTKTKEQGHPCYKNGSICQNISFHAEYSSITTEWKLICNQEYMVNVGQTVILAGGFTGAVVFAGLADQYGRRFAIILMQSLSATCCCLSGLAQSYNQFLVLRFFAEAFLSSSGMTIFVLFSEILGPGSRDSLLTLHQGFFSCGFVVLALSAYLLPNWRALVLATSLPSVICTVFFLHSIICESPQWLLEKGRVEEGKQLLKDMAKINGSEITDETLAEISKVAEKQGATVSQGDNGAFAMERYFKIIILASIWFLVGLLYNGLSFSSNTSNNKYISFSLSGLVEIPSLFVSNFLMKSGRKISIFSLLISAAFSCFLYALLLGGEYDVMTTFLGMIGKFGVAAAFSILYIFSAELFPATVRNTFVSICSMASRAGGVLAPLVLYIAVYDKRLPLFLFGVGAISAAVFVLVLPVGKSDEMLEKKKVG